MSKPIAPPPHDVDPQKGYSQYVESWGDVRKSLLDWLGPIDEDHLHKPGPDGSWSIAQAVEHLYLTQSKFARTLKIINSGRFPVETARSAPFDFQLAEAYFTGEQRATNPKNVEPSDSFTKGQMDDNLSKSFRLMEDVLENTDWNSPQIYIPHELFGPATIAEYLWILIHHEAMHLEKMRSKWGK